MLRKAVSLRYQLQRVRNKQTRNPAVERSCLWDVDIDIHLYNWTLGPALGPGDGCFSVCLKLNCSLSIICQASVSPSMRLKMHKGMVESSVCSLYLDFGNYLYCLLILIFSHFCVTVNRSHL